MYDLNAWNNLKTECLSCTRCEISSRRRTAVFGRGSPEAKLMLVGEAPGRSEDEEGLPFVGRAGRLLSDYLEYFELPLDKIYITNLLKCRPDQNRDPSAGEIENCLPILRGQFKIIRPGIIVAVGRFAALTLIKPDFKISSERGRWFKKNGVLMTAVYHPAALLRSPELKITTFSDFAEIKKRFDALPPR